MTELYEYLDYYRLHSDEARRIAINGYLYAMKYHRTVNMIDYVLRTTIVKSHLISNKMLFKQYQSTGIYYNYTYTGQYLYDKSMKQLKNYILKHNIAGNYSY